DTPLGPVPLTTRPPARMSPCGLCLQSAINPKAPASKHCGPPSEKFWVAAWDGPLPPPDGPLMPPKSESKDPITQPIYDATCSATEANVPVRSERILIPRATPPAISNSELSFTHRPSALAMALSP